MQTAALSIALSMGAFAAPSVALSEPAKGAAPTPGEKLFREGREAMDRKELAVACAKFRESYELEHVVTSLLNEADCEEKRGRLATSYRLWQEGRSKADDDATKSFTDGRVKALAPRVPTLKVLVASAKAKNAVVSLDGVAMAAGESVPVDPGDHVLEARAPGFEPETRRISVAEGKSSEETMLATPVASATIGEVEPSNEPGPSAPAKSSKGSKLKTAGFIVGGVGVVGIATFGVTGAMILAKKGDKSCPNFECKSSERPQALLGINAVALGLGVVGIGVAIPLLVVGSQKDAPATSLVVGPTFDGAGASLRGSF